MTTSWTCRLFNYTITFQLTDNNYAGVYPAINDNDSDIWQGFAIQYNYNDEIYFARPERENDCISDDLGNCPKKHNHTARAVVIRQISF